MYSLINRNIEHILDSIDYVKDIQPYIKLLEQLNKTNVFEDKEYQRIYRWYWQLNPARLSEQYLAEYFKYMENNKFKPESVNVTEVANYLLLIPTHRNGRKYLQFSFASKLVHTLHPESPVYDSTIERFFFLPAGGMNETTDQKIVRLQKSYEFLRHEYWRVLEHELLKLSISRFRERFQVNEIYTDTKVIDTLLWKFVGYLRTGAVRDGKIIFD